MRGNGGDDLLSLSLQDAAGTSSYGPKAAAIVCGGIGTDRAATEGNAALLVRGCE